MKAEGSYVTNWKGILTPANWEPPNRRFGRSLIPLLPSAVGDKGIPSAFYLLPSTSCLLPSAFCLLPSTFYLLPPAFYLLPSAFCLLPSAFCLLPSTFFLSWSEDKLVTLVHHSPEYNLIVCHFHIVDFQLSQLWR
jgi:hypothetical protein